MATQAQVNDFIQKIAPLMVAEAKKRRYNIVSTAIAQAGVESAWGLSGLAKYHNYFGMKCGKSWKGKSVNMKTKEEYTPGTLTTINDNFRVYDSMADGVKGYYDFISSSRYFNLKIASTPRQYAEYLKADGYATSSTYVSTLINTVNKCGLTVYDNGLNDDPNRNPYNEPTKNVRLNSKGNDVRWVQVELNRKGYHLTVDGYCGNLTVDAIKAFQFAHGLAVDGIVGSATREKLKGG
ncbi:MAG: peptidoglycan-binding protein [Lachnospiraceae bacterium]|nr:peptidoglycan-binding protein [Lachnospiraceae bacterium]